MTESTPATSPVKKRRSWWRWPLRVFLVLLLAFVVFRITVYWRVQTRLNAIRADGYPVTLEELDAWYPYPDGPNAADVYQRAFEAYTENEDIEESLPIFNTDIKLPPPGEPLPDDMAQLIEDYLADKTEAIGLLEEATKIKECRFPVDMTNGYLVEQPYLGKLRHGARLLQLKSVLEANQGAYDLAEDRCVAIISMAESLDNELTIISSLVRISILGQALDQIERLIQTRQVGDKSIDELSRVISAIEIDRITFRSMAGDRCVGISMYDHPLKIFNEIDVFFGGKPDNPLANTISEWSWWSSGLADMDKAAYIDLLNLFCALAGNPEWPLPGLKSAINDTPKPFWLTRTIYPSSATIRVSLEMRARQSVFLTGLAAERYRQRNSMWPHRLEDLAPEFLEAVPTDPFTGQPLCYRLEDGGAIIYSIGSDGIDDGGRERDEKDSKYGDHIDITFTFGGLQQKLWPVEEVAD